MEEHLTQARYDAVVAERDFQKAQADAARARAQVMEARIARVIAVAGGAP